MGEQSFIFADLAGFTRLTEAHGDVQAANVAQSYAASSRRLAEDHGAEQVKTIGDAVLMRVPDPAGALAFGVRMVGEIGAQHGFPAVRVGIDHGPAEERNGDYFGRTVNVAARVAALAGAGEVLLTDAVRSGAGSVADIDIRHYGRHSLKGIVESVNIFSAARVGVDPDKGLPVDPVCHMAVDPDRCGAELDHWCTRYFFCSEACRDRFVSDPRKYVDSKGCILKKKKKKLGLRLGWARG